MYLDVAVTDRTQGLPSTSNLCRFVSVMPFWNAAAQKPYIVICLRTLVEVWDKRCGIYNADQSWQGVVDKIYVPCEGKGKGKGKGRGGTTGTSKGQRAYH